MVTVRYPELSQRVFLGNILGIFEVWPGENLVYLGMDATQVCPLWNTSLLHLEFLLGNSWVSLGNLFSGFCLSFYVPLYFRVKFSEIEPCAFPLFRFSMWRVNHIWTRIQSTEIILNLQVCKKEMWGECAGRMLYHQSELLQLCQGFAWCLAFDRSILWSHFFGDYAFLNICLLKITFQSFKLKLANNSEVCGVWGIVYEMRWF